METTFEEQNKVKKKKKEKETEDSPPLGQYQTHQHSNYRGSLERREKERV